MRYYNTFISYKRSYGADQATMIYYALREKGISVFMDVGQSEAGSYSERIMNVLKSCDNMLLILVDNTIGNLADESDWIRRELLVAKEASINIIPIVFPGANIDFDSVPPSIKEMKLSSLQAIQYSHEHSKLVIEQIVGFLKKSIDRWECVELLMSNLSAQCKAKGLGEFILSSSEMRMLPSSEVHLLTNNLRDYDMTVIAKMAISNNIAKETKYIYYCPPECEADYLELKTEVMWYLEKTIAARNEIDRWIRAYYLSNTQICVWLNRINKISSELIINDFFEPVCDKCKTTIKEKIKPLLIRDLQSGYEQIDVSYMLEWINGIQKTTAKIKRAIGIFEDISNVLCSECNCIDEFSLNEWKKNCDLLSQLLVSSNWIVENNTEDFSRAIDFLYSIRVDEQIIEWLQIPAKSFIDVQAAIKNMYFCSLKEETTPVKCCYNFSLLLNPEGSIAAAGWYKASAMKIQTYTQDVSENVLMIKGLDGKNKGILKKILISILEQQSELKNTLKSKLFLGNS